MTAFLATATVASADRLDWSDDYKVANGLNFQRIFTDDDPTGSTLRLVRAGNYYEYYGYVTDYGHDQGPNSRTYPGTGQKNYLQVGYTSYSETSYVIPAEVDGMPVVEIEASAFYGNKNIKDITFPAANLTVISSEAFRDCTALETLHFDGSSIREIGVSAFRGCTALKSIDSWGVVDHICNTAFWQCTGLESVTIAPTVKTIEYNAFAGCTGLKTVIIEDSESYLRIPTGHTQSIFASCSYIEKVYIGRKISYPEGNGRSGVFFGGHTLIKEVEFGQPVDTIQAYLFYNGQSAMTVKAPYAKYIGKCAFYQSKITGIDMPQLKEVGEEAFYWSGLKGINLYSAEKIERRAFMWSAVEEITIPTSVKSIGSQAFNGVSSLTSFSIEDSDDEIELGVDENFTDEEPAKRYNNSGWLSGSSIQSLYIGRPIGHENLTTEINGALYFSNGAETGNGILGPVKTITLSRATILPRDAFGNCLYLETVSIPQVTELPDYCFRRCWVITSVDMPKVTKFGSYVFQKSGLKSITIPGRVTTIGSMAFEDSDLESVTLEYSPTKLDGSFGKTSKELFIDRDLSGGLTCSKSVTFGTNVTTLDGYYFSSSAIETVRCLNPTPIALEVETSSDDRHGPLFPAYYGNYLVQENATLIVPKGSLAAYKAAPVWKGFKNIIDDEGGTVEPLAGDANGDGKVDAADIVEVVNYLNGHPSARFNETNANANGVDGVTTEDIDAVVGIIMGK